MSSVQAGRSRSTVDGFSPSVRLFDVHAVNLDVWTRGGGAKGEALIVAGGTDFLLL